MIVRPLLRRARCRRRRILPSRWCHGIPGAEHQPQMLVSASGKRRIAAVGRPCGPERGIGRWGWSCAHVIACSGCGRQLRLFPADICPDRPDLHLSPDPRA